MMIEAFYRRVLLPAFETGYKRRKTLGYLGQLEQSQWWEPGRLARAQAAALQRLLQHAARHCPYYREQWQRLDLRPEEFRERADFHRWPIVDKAVIRENRPAMRADPPLGPLISKSTGGSSGEPLHFDLDQRSHERRVAATLRGYGWAGARLGTKQFYLWGAALTPLSLRQRCKDRFYNFIQRRHVANCFHLSDHTTPQFLQQLNAYRPDVVVAYTGALYQFARNLEERKLRPYSPHAVIVGAEQLHDFQRDLIESVFQAPVFETYGSREFMLIGAECPEHSGLHLTTEQLVVEILDDAGQPVPEGQVGDVVVTDLYNYGMPFIRYATGDQAVAGFGSCSCGRGLPLLQKVTGRRLDVLATPDGRRVPGEFFPHLFKDYAAVRQFQVVQKAQDRVQLRVVLADTWSESEQRQIVQQITQVMGPQVQLDWQPVEQIERTPAGKHRVVVREMNG